MAKRRVLWREMAWKEGRPNRSVQLSADEILAAESRLRQALRNEASKTE